MWGCLSSPSSVKGGSSIPAVAELSQVPRDQRTRKGGGSEEASCCWQVKAKGTAGRHCSPLQGTPQRCTVVSSPPPGSLVRHPCLDSEPADASTHPKERTPCISRPYSVLTLRSLFGHPAKQTNTIHLPHAPGGIPS